MKTIISSICGRPLAYAVIAGVALLAQVLIVKFELIEAFFQYSQAHEDWELDEYLGLGVVLSVTLTVVLALRGRDLAREIGSRKRAEAQAQMIARHDALTGLPNRRLVNEELERRVAMVGTEGATVAVLLIDLDRFKPINDAHGHAVGDLLLQQVADRLRAACVHDEIAGRMGGDEFAVITSTADGSDHPARLARRLLGEIERTFFLDNKSFDISASIGIAVATPDVRDGKIVLQHADIAMYRAKSTGRNTLAFFETELDLKVQARAGIEADLKRALRCDEIVPYFQPLVSIADRRLTGLEVLARWKHPSKGIILPEDFISVAEDTGMIGDITWTVLRKACLFAASWESQLPIAINLSPIQFHDRWLAQKIMAILQETGFPAKRLEIEITENAMIADFEQTRVTLLSLKNQGVKLSLDDFGTGYSSLRNLRELPFDKIKIDRSFVIAGNGSEDNRKIVSAIVGLSHSLGIPATAEGIETEDAADWLVSIGCDQGQGFFYSYPLEASDVEALLAEHCAADQPPVVKAAVA